MANITLLGASYTDVPAVTLPQTGGGTVTFYENSGGTDYLFEKITNSTVSQYSADLDGAAIGTRAFDSWSGLQSVHLINTATIGQYCFNSCTGLVSAVIRPKTSGTGGKGNAFNGCSKLEVVDLTNPNAIPAQWFYNCSKMVKLILRSNSIVALNNVNAFSGTPFKNGGTGGTIYIPKTLYDHLGDGGASDYKAASNWATVNGYRTITWAKIEGSQYESAYADGTSIT